MVRKRRATPLSRFVSDLPSPFAPDTRSKLVKANPGFEVDESRLYELDRVIAKELFPQSISAGAKVRREELAEIGRAAAHLLTALTAMHPRTRGELAATYQLEGCPRDSVTRLEDELERLRAFAATTCKEVPGSDGGRPTTELRDGIVRATVQWVCKLKENRGRSGTNAALTRNAEMDRVHRPLSRPSDTLEERCAASVKIVCGAVRLKLPYDIVGIVRKALREKPG